MSAKRASMTPEVLMREAMKAREASYSPYSRFAVGAALLGASGRVYQGCNVENASFGLTCCAERTALFKAVSEGEKDFVACPAMNDSSSHTRDRDSCTLSNSMPLGGRFPDAPQCCRSFQCARRGQFRAMQRLSLSRAS